MRQALRLLPLYRPYLGWIALSLLCAVLAALAGAGLMAVSGYFIAAMAAAGAAGASINYYTPSALVRTFAIVRTAARYGERVIGHEATLRVVAEARGWLFQKLAPLAPGALADLRSGEMLARLKTDIDRLEHAFLRVAAPFFVALLATLAIAGFVALYEPRIALLFLALAALAGALVPLGFAPRLRRAAAETARLHGERRSALVDQLDGLGDLLGTGAFEARFEEARALYERQSAYEEREHAALAWTQSFAALAGDAAMLGALALGALAIHAGRLAAADATMLTLLVASGFEPLTALPAAFAALPAAAVSIRRVLALAERAPLVGDPATPGPAPRGFDLALDHVGYAYPGAAQPALQDVSLHIPEGGRVAIVGGSGAGKTTMIDLMLRVRDPDRGEVRLGGVAESALGVEAVRARFAVAPQFPHLFDRSLADNLRLGAPDATEEEMRAALGRVGLDGLLAQLPAGLASDVGPLGAKLSVGQSRRVAIARAVLAPRPILLLDEPMEGLDAETARHVIDNLLADQSGRTLIAVTHSAETRARIGEVYSVGGGGLSVA